MGTGFSESRFATVRVTLAAVRLGGGERDGADPVVVQVRPTDALVPVTLSGLDARPALAEGLIGRTEELEVIEQLLDRIQRDGESLVLLGEAGIGKTVLLHAAADNAADADIRVLQAAGVQYEAEITFSGLHQTLLSLHHEFADLSDTHRDVLNATLGFGDGPVPDRMLITNAVLALLWHVAAKGPLLLVIDDLPWLDRASAGVLSLVARRLKGSRVGFLAAARSGEESYFEHAGLPTLELGPLDRSASNQLIGSRYPRMSASLRGRIVEEARGNPLALLELPSALDDGTKVGATSRAPRTPGERPLRLFSARIEGLPEETRRLLLLAALDGTGDLRILIGAGAGARRDLGPAERARLVYVDDQTRRLEFHHPLVRTVVVDLSTADERHEAHLALAELFADAPDRRAWHLASAADGPDEQVAAALEDVAHNTLLRGDATGAVAALTRASDLSASHTDRARRLAEAAYIGANVNGALTNATTLLDEARRADPDAEGSIFSAMAAAFVLINGDGDVDTAHRLLMRAIETIGAEGAPSAIEEALHTLFLPCYFAGRPEFWADFHRALEACPKPLPVPLYLANTAYADPLHATDEVLAVLDKAIDGLADVDNPVEVLRIAGGALFLDRISLCRDPLLRVVRDGRDGGVVALAITALSYLATDAVQTGLWDEAVQMADECLELCDTHGYGLLAWTARQHKACIAGYRGDIATTQRLSDEMRQWATPRRAGAVHSWCSLALLNATLTLGDFERSYQLATAISPAGVLPPWGSTAVYTFLDIVESAMRTGRATEARAHVQAMRAANVARLSPRLAMVSGACEAMIASDQEAPALFEHALAVPGADRWVFDYARVQLLYGERLRRVRASTESRPPLTRALELFRGMGSAPWAERAAAELRASGHDVRRSHTMLGGELTPQEREIAVRAARGLSNKEIGQELFLSPRTVGAHLYRIFPKLGITSRAALRDALDAVDRDHEAHTTHR